MGLGAAPMWRAGVAALLISLVVAAHIHQGRRAAPDEVAGRSVRQRLRDTLGSAYISDRALRNISEILLDVGEGDANAGANVRSKIKK